MPVLIRIDGKPELWGNTRLGLSRTEMAEFDELHALHKAKETDLHLKLVGENAAMDRFIRTFLDNRNSVPLCASLVRQSE